MRLTDWQGGAPEMVTERTRMRLHVAGDLDASARIWANGDVVRYIGGKTSTRSESWSRLLRYVGHWHALGFGYWAVEDRRTGTYLGEVGFADFKRDIAPGLDGVPEIGWVLSPHAQGRGIASEAVAAAVGWGDRNFKVEKTICLFDRNHAASIRVAAKNGYVEPPALLYPDLPMLLMERRLPARNPLKM